MGGKGSKKARRDPEEAYPSGLSASEVSSTLSVTPEPVKTQPDNNNTIGKSEPQPHFDTGPHHPTPVSNNNIRTAIPEDSLDFVPAVQKHRGPPPKREVEQSHHHHHVITVDSDTDFTKMHIDVRKVNFLPYNPAVAISQTGLIQSIGRPFNRNHAKNLPDPGDEFKLTRRVSQVKLHQVVLLGDVDGKAIAVLSKIIKMFSTLIAVAGVVFFVYMLCVAAIYTPMEYPMHFLDSNLICKLAYIAGTVQPFGVAPYCRYALINLQHIRIYFLRVPISLVFPTAVVLCGLDQFYEVYAPEGDMTNFLYGQIDHYYGKTYMSIYARETWDGIQNKYDCCGYQNHNEWRNKSSEGISIYPKSCCKDQTHNCTASKLDLKKHTCRGPYRRANLLIATVFCILGILIIILEVVSVVFMKSLFGRIGEELYDERSDLSIMWGKICSLCDIESTDEELEYDEICDDEQHRRRRHQYLHHERADEEEQELVNKPGTSKQASSAPITRKSGLGGVSTIKNNRVAPR